MSLSATQKYRLTPKGVLTNLYSKMKERAKYKNIESPNFTLIEFHNLFLENKIFIRLYKEWVKNNYNKVYKPSVARINRKYGYILNNIHIISWGDNRFKQSMERRSRKGKVLQILNGKIVKVWSSQRDAYKKLNLSQSMLSGALTGKYKQAYGYIWKYATNDDPELLENKQ